MTQVVQSQREATHCPMRVLIVAADLSPTALFDLVVKRDVSQVLDLRIASSHTGRLLGRVYHRPSKVLADVIFQRVVLEWCSPMDAAPSENRLMVLVDHERADEVQARVLALRADAQIEVV
jgi:hypothetical protein